MPSEPWRVQRQGRRGSDPKMPSKTFVKKCRCRKYKFFFQLLAEAVAPPPLRSSFKLGRGEGEDERTSASYVVVASAAFSVCGEKNLFVWILFLVVSPKVVLLNLVQ